MPGPAFDITAEKRATIRHFLYRQLCVTPPLPRGVDLTGKTAIVTGANGGLGLECARQLLDLGLSKLIIAVRNESKGQAARRDLFSGRDMDDDAIEVWELDLLHYDSIMYFVKRVENDVQRLDIVVLNAGIWQHHYEVAPTGHENTIQVNVLSTALLMILLLPTFVKTSTLVQEPSRVVAVSSDIASWAKFKEQGSDPLLPALDKPEAFSMPDRYCTSKLLGQLFVTEFVKRIPSSVAVVNMPNPGMCYGTSLGHDGGGFLNALAAIPIRALGRSSAVGARCLIDAAVNHGKDSHGQYVEDGKLQP